jgi:hypothetical protein
MLLQNLFLFLYSQFMALHASCVHGNALVIENTGNLTSLGHFGLGTDVRVKAGKDTTCATSVIRVWVLFYQRPQLLINLTKP